MTGCKQWQERIALAAGGDLSGAEQAVLDRHLAGCPPCAAELAAVQQSLEVLVEAHREPLGESHFAAVRARVMAQIERRRNPRWQWAAALAAAALLLTTTIWHTPGHNGHKKIAAPASPPPGAAVVHAAVPPFPAHRSLRHPVRRARAVEGPPEVPPEPVVVKLLTDDPNVVIYWIGDSQ